MTEIPPLVLTGTIRVREGQIGVHGDPDRRRRQYAETLRWLAGHSQGLRHFIFCENSGEEFPEFGPLKALFARRGSTLELFRCELPANKAVPGKGWGEGWMIEQVLTDCPSLLAAKSFFKLTGRYKPLTLGLAVGCIDRALSGPEDPPRFVCESFRETAQGPYAGTCFFWAQTEFFREHLLKTYSGVNDRSGVYLEHVIGRKLAELSAQHRIGVLPFISIFEGISGFSGKPLNNRAERFKILLKNMIRNKADLRRLKAPVTMRTT